MEIFKGIIIGILCVALVTPSDSLFFRRRRSRRLFRRFRLGFRKARNFIRHQTTGKQGCRNLWGVACPVAVAGGAAFVAAGSGGTGAALAAGGAVVATKGCGVAAKRCKRSVVSGSVLLPFPEKFQDYDRDGDKLITYEEFMFAVTHYVNLRHPSDLVSPFMFADMNSDGQLDTQEFHGAPFLFGNVAHDSNGNVKPAVLYVEPAVNPILQQLAPVSMATQQYGYSPAA